MPRPLPRPATVVARCLCLVLLAALAGCGEPDEVRQEDVASTEPLPGPRQADGAITDMPAAPGPGEVPLAGTPPPPPPAPELAPGDGYGLPPLHENPEAGLDPATADAAAAGQSAPAAAPPADPRDVLRGYYAAINARDYAAAYAAWLDGAAAAQTPSAFAAGFTDIASVELTVGEPQPVEGAAGSLQVEVPVTVTSTLADGGSRHQAGRYTLRRAQADGATPAQRAWRIVAVDLRDAVR